MSRSIFLISFLFVTLPMKAMDVKDDSISSFMAQPHSFVESLDDEDESSQIDTLRGHEDLRRMRHSLPIPASRVKCSGDAQFSSAGNRVLSITEDSVVVVDRALDETVTLEGHEGAITSVAVVLAGQRCATGSLDAIARVWDTKTGECIGVIPHETAVKKVLLNGQASRLFTVTQDSFLHLWDLESGTELFSIESNCAANVQALLNKAGDQIVVATKEYGLFILNGEEVIIPETVHTDGIVSLAHSPSEKRLVTASLDGTARVWSVWGSCIGELKGHDAAVVSARFDSKGTFVVTASEDGTAKVWELTGNCLMTIEGHTGGLTDARFNDEGSRIITASRDKTARIWCTCTGELLLPMEGHKREVYEAGFIGQRAYTLSKDGTGLLCDVDYIIAVFDSLSVEQLLFIGSVMKHMREVTLFDTLTPEEVLMNGLPWDSVIKPFELKGHKALQSCYESLPTEVKEMFKPFVREDLDWIAQFKEDYIDCWWEAKRRTYRFE